jgi:hypothetical protein
MDGIGCNGLTTEAYGAKVGNPLGDMFRERNGPRAMAGVLLLAVIMGGGCASLKPGAASLPPEQGGGIKMSDEWAGFLGYVSPAIYILGEWLAVSSGSHR